MGNQRPPTTSGITIISGSNNFNVANSDFPVVTGGVIQGGIIPVPPEEDPPFLIMAFDPILIEEIVPVILNPSQFVILDQVILTGGFIPDVRDDIHIIPTTVTTSGITIIEFFPDAGLSGSQFVPPIFSNSRLFPISASNEFVRTFPEKNRRIFPVLPQFSTIIPGD